jgi:putative Ca2+/H+ antiporter (TMEM165/GDT1 family)
MPGLVIFGTIFLAELPDKTSVMTLALLGRLPLRIVWGGAALALVAQTIIALTAGRLLAFVPKTPLTVVEVCLLLGFAIWLWRESNEPAPERGFDTARLRARTPLRSLLSVFGVIFAAEFLDLTQLATMTYAAAYPAHILQVGAIAALALLCANAAVVLIGGALWARVSGPWLHRIAAILFALVAVFMAASQWGLLSVSL